MKKFEEKYLIEAAAQDVFEALTDPFKIMSWSGAPAIMDANAGSQFSLFGGFIMGENLEVSKNKRIVQDWRIQGWEKSSKVTLELKEEEGKTEISLIHENVPDSEIKEIESAWNQYFFERIQLFFAN